MSPLVQLDQVSIGYGKKIVLNNVSFLVNPKDYFALVGPNGCGKSTILKAILGIVGIYQGKLTRSKSLVIGYVPQRETLDVIFPISVQEVVIMGRYSRIGLLRKPTQEDHQKVDKVLQHVGLYEKKHLLFRNLSGGQRQRILLARALVNEPELLILDEPTNGLDYGSEQDILDLLDTLQERQNMAIIFVSHNLNLVAQRAHKMALITGNGHFTTGTTSEILDEKVLSKLYNRPIKIREDLLSNA